MIRSFNVFFHLDQDAPLIYHENFRLQLILTSIQIGRMLYCQQSRLVKLPFSLNVNSTEMGFERRELDVVGLIRLHQD